MIIGLTGKKRSGKDTAGNYLVNRWGFQRFAFADKLKESAYGINPLISVYGTEYLADLAIQDMAIDSLEKGWLVRLKDLVDYLGWEKAKEIEEVRRFLQETGTKGGRQVHGDNIWVDKFFKKDFDLDNQHIVVTDIRFDNEAETILTCDIQTDVLIWELEREQTQVIDKHVSEAGISRKYITHYIKNDGDVTDLYETIEHILKYYRV